MGVRNEAANIAGALDRGYIDAAAQILQSDSSWMDRNSFQSVVSLANYDRQNPNADSLQMVTDVNSGLPVVQIVDSYNRVERVVPLAGAPEPEQYPGYPPPAVPGSPDYDYPGPGSPMYDAPQGPQAYYPAPEEESPPCSGSTVAGGLLGSIVGSAISGRRPLVGAIVGGIAGAAVGNAACGRPGQAGGGY